MHLLIILHRGGELKMHIPEYQIKKILEVYSNQLKHKKKFSINGKKATIIKKITQHIIEKITNVINEKYNGNNTTKKITVMKEKETFEYILLDIFNNKTIKTLSTDKFKMLPEITTFVLNSDEKLTTLQKQIISDMMYNGRSILEIVEFMNLTITQTKEMIELYNKEKL